jgi:hypothetical protein
VISATSGAITAVASCRSSNDHARDIGAPSRGLFFTPFFTCPPEIPTLSDWDNGSPGALRTAETIHTRRSVDQSNPRRGPPMRSRPGATAMPTTRWTFAGVVAAAVVTSAGTATRQFRLAPAAPPARQAFNLVNASHHRLTTWGGSVVRDPSTGLHHIYASAFTNSCGLCGWETNSEVLHGVSAAGPDGPYNLSIGVAIPTYAHNPQVVYSERERLYLLFVLGVENHTAAIPCVRGQPVHRYPGLPPWLSTVSLHTARSPNGPWTMRSESGGGGVIARGLNANPTAWINRTSGEITLLYGRFDRPHRPHRRFYSVVTAASSAGPWVPRGDLPATLDPPRHCSQNVTSPWYQCWCNNEVRSTTNPSITGPAAAACWPTPHLPFLPSCAVFKKVLRCAGDRAPSPPSPPPFTFGRSCACP